MGCWWGEKSDIPCPCPVKCLWEPFPPLLHLFCFLPACSMDKDPSITCKLLCYFCWLMPYTDLPFLPFMGLFVFFPAALSPGITFGGISGLLTHWSAVLSSYPECCCHISPTWCIRILILSDPWSFLLLQAEMWLWGSQWLELDGPSWKTRLIEMLSFTLQLYLLEGES